MIAVGAQVYSADWTRSAPPEEADAIRGFFTLPDLTTEGFKIVMLPQTVIIYASGQVRHGKDRAPGTDVPQINSTLYVSRLHVCAQPVHVLTQIIIFFASHQVQHRLVSNVTLASARAHHSMDTNEITAEGKWKVQVAKKTHAASTRHASPSSRSARLEARNARNAGR